MAAKAKKDSVAAKHSKKQSEFYADEYKACANLKNHPKWGNKKYDACIAHAKKVQSKKKK